MRLVHPAGVPLVLMRRYIGEPCGCILKFTIFDHNFKFTYPFTAVTTFLPEMFSNFWISGISGGLAHSFRAKFASLLCSISTIGGGIRGRFCSSPCRTSTSAFKSQRSFFYPLRTNSGYAPLRQFINCRLHQPSINLSMSTSIH